MFTVKQQQCHTALIQYSTLTMPRVRLLLCGLGERRVLQVELCEAILQLGDRLLVLKAQPLVVTHLQPCVYASPSMRKRTNTLRLSCTTTYNLRTSYPKRFRA